MRSMCRVFTIFALVAVLWPARASAQSVAQANSVTVTPFASVTFGPSTEPDLDLGSSIGLGAALGYDWTSNLGFEFEFGRVFDVAGDLSALDMNLTTISGNVIYHFDVLRVTPYATVGLGWQRTGISVEDDALEDSSETEIAWNFGGGIKYPINDRVLARADLRRFQVNDLGPDHWRLYGGLTFWLKR
jgi:opacity protein-like surface antigen